MRLRLAATSVLLVLAHFQAARSDFVGPSVARHALSPDGQLLVRIETGKGENQSNDAPKHEVVFFEFDSSKDAYVRSSSFQLSGHLSQMLYVSNSGDLVMISLGEKSAIRLYARAGALVKSWNLQDVLTENEIRACAQTGSTLQWLEEGAFFNRVFYLRGPSRLIRALSPPYTVMRGADEKVTFTALIDAENAKLTKEQPEEP